MKIPDSFYTRTDVVLIARELLGKWLFTGFREGITAGIITETEAYAGVTDRASHAWNNRNTARTGVMYREGGCAYVYLCYGIHSLFNIVTNRDGVPDAVLIRAIKPVLGLDIMRARAGRKDRVAISGNGPGRVSSLLGIHYSHTGTSLQGPLIWLEDKGFVVNPADIMVSGRVGVEYAAEDALLPYRFFLPPESIPKGQ